VFIHREYVDASVTMGQSEPNISRCGPKASIAVSIYGRICSAVQLVQLDSVTMPDSLQYTFSRRPNSIRCSRQG